MNQTKGLMEKLKTKPLSSPVSVNPTTTDHHTVTLRKLVQTIMLHIRLYTVCFEHTLNIFLITSKTAKIIKGNTVHHHIVNVYLYWPPQSNVTFYYLFLLVSVGYSLHVVLQFLCTFILITGRICRRQLCRCCFYQRPGFGVFRPAGATRCTDQGEIWHWGADRRSAPLCQISPWSAQRWGLRPPKLKKWNFTNIIAPKGRVPWTIFTKFTGYMRVLSLDNFAKCGCFISITDKISNNLLRWGRFQLNFRRPLGAKLSMEPKKVWELKWWHGPPLSPCKIWWKSRDARRHERTKCDVFHFFIFFYYLKTLSAIDRFGA